MLFQYQKFSTDGSAALDTLQAPLAKLQFSAAFGTFDSLKQTPTYIHKLPSGCSVTGWQRENCHVELLLCALNRTVGVGRQVDGRAAALFRVRALDTLQAMSFTAALCDLPADVEIGPESGIGIDAQSWMHNGQMVMLATEDGDVLSERASRRDWMPFRLKERLASRFPQYLPDRLVVNVPALDSAELCQVQFVVAWLTNPKEDNTATLAVDRNPNEILAAAGCS